MVLGHAVGDALGVPVAYGERQRLQQHPVKDMLGFGAYPVPQGSWSDVTSLPLACMSSMLQTGYADYAQIMQEFSACVDHGKYTPDGEAFEIGHSSRHAIKKFQEGVPPLACGGQGTADNGCAALTRMDPAILYLYARHGNDLEPEDMQVIRDMASLTNAHAISCIACGVYVLLGVELCHGTPLERALELALATARDYYGLQPDHGVDARKAFLRLENIAALRQLPAEEISSDGYVVHVLEATLWVLLNTPDYEQAVIRAVSLGNNTNSLGGVTGSLAAMLYGREAIPERWLRELRAREQLTQLAQAFEERF